MSWQLVLEIELPGLPPTLNARLHWAAKHRLCKQWKRAVEVAVWRKFPSDHIREIVGLPLPKAKLILTRFSTREPDFDNLASGMKWPIDGLKEAGVILDDKPSVIGTPELRWEKAKAGHGKIRIEVYTI